MLDTRFDSVRIGLESEVAATRESAALLAGRGRMAGAVPLLTKALRDEVEEVRAAAAWALGQLRDRSSASALVATLCDPSFVVRSNAGWALVYIGEEVVGEVADVLGRSVHADAREMAYLVLARIQSSAARAALRGYGTW